MLTLNIGHRVSRRCRTANRRFQLKSIISLPDSAMQRRSLEDHTARRDPLHSPGRDTTITSRHFIAKLPTKVVTALRKEHRRLSMHMVVQLSILTRRRHVQRRVDPDAQEVWCRL